MDQVTFSWVDSVIFLLSLALPLLIGVYFGFVKKKQNSAHEYLYGIGKITAVPIGLSLYSSAVSGLVFLAIPAELYVFGGQYLCLIFGYILSFVLTYHLIIPVFCGTLKLSSPYDYMELRFNYTVRLLSTCIYVLHTLLFMPIVLYASILAFSEATGLPLVTCTVVLGGLCVFYTTVGGFSSVIWTDTLQAALMFGAIIFLLCRGISEVGSIGEVWRRADQGQRLDVFNFDPNPFIRLSTFSVVLGQTVWQTGHCGCTASAIQRYMALSNERQGKLGSFIAIIGASVTMTLASCIGLCMYALFYDCDPVESKKLSAYSKIVPYYITQFIGNAPGFIGFYTAGLLSAGLSTISAEMNTVGGLIYHDIVQKLYKKPLSPMRELLVMKVIVCITGVLYLIATPVFQKSKYLTPMAVSLAGITYGVKVGVILLGTTFPKCNVKGVLSGMITALALVSWITIGGMQYDLFGPYKLPMCTENCPSLSNNSTVLLNNITQETSSNSTMISTTVKPVEPFILYKLSFMYYPVVGLLTTILVAMAVSYVTGFNDVNKMDPRLIIPSVRPARQERSILLTSPVNGNT